MEQITKVDGKYYYGKTFCRDISEAYRLFRNDYHRSLGKRVYRRLDKAPRQERVHGYGFVSSGASWDGDRRRVPVRLLGLVCGSYCRMLGGWDVPCSTEDEFEQWFEWAFSKGSGALRLAGRKEKAGRTSKRLNARYR